MSIKNKAGKDGKDALRHINTVVNYSGIKMKGNNIVLTVVDDGDCSDYYQRWYYIDINDDKGNTVDEGVVSVWWSDHNNDLSYYISLKSQEEEEDVEGIVPGVK